MGLVMKIFASLLSVVLHPFLLPVYVLLVIFQSGTLFSFIPGRVQALVYLMTVMGVVILPLLCMPILKRFKLIESYHLLQKQERVFPVFVTVLGTFFAFYLLRHVPYTEVVRQLYLVLVILLAGFMILTIRWKISMHMTAIGAVCGYVFILGAKYLGDTGYLLMALILLSGILGTCRLYLKRHTPAQVYAGYVYGCALVVGVLY